jgi:5-methyltetrahydrofolate--homocysteine methyltransferase
MHERCHVLHLLNSVAAMCLTYSGEEAKKLFNDAQTMLSNIVSKKLLKCEGVIGFYRAQSVGDDIELYDNDGSLIATLYGLRQQVIK